MEEKRRRIKTEKRLRLAEDSLKRLDRALRDSGVQIDIEIETDVKNLKGKVKQGNFRKQCNSESFRADPAKYFTHGGS